MPLLSRSWKSAIIFIIFFGLLLTELLSLWLGMLASTGQRGEAATIIKPNADTVGPVKSSYDRPPLEAIVNGWNITGNASWLLDFAIVGFPKCGTSSLMFHLQNHPQVKIHSDERCDLGFNQQAKLIKALYNDFPAGPYRRGIKCPFDLENPSLSMKNYLKFFPQTRFVVGIRHPVLW
jgi:hypothetical protein